MRRPLVVVLLALAMVMALGASTAFAGEITGNGKSLKVTEHELHGKSLCAFSGLNDWFIENPGVPDPEGFGRTQSWGQIPKAMRDLMPAVFHPGNSCNPNGEPIAH